MSTQTPGTSLADRMADRAAAGAGTQVSILDQIRKQEGELAKALPGAVDTQRFIRIAITVMRTNPKLMQCTAPSVLGAIMTTAQLGLELGPLGLSYLVPYFNNKSRTYECQLIIGYRGYCELARRSGGVKDIVARPVYANDEWDFFSDENGDHMLHRRAEGDRGDLRLFYGRIVYTNGGNHVEVMTLDEIDKRKARSQSADSSYSPWNTDYEAMCSKTVIRAMTRWLPLTTEIEQKLAADEHVINLRGQDLVPSFPSGEGPGLPATDDEPPLDAASRPAEGEPAQQEPPPADEAPPRDETEPPPTEPQRQPAKADDDRRTEVTQHTMTVVSSWDEATVERICRQFEIPHTGRFEVRRTRLATELARMRLEGNEAAEGLF